MLSGQRVQEELVLLDARELAFSGSGIRRRQWIPVVIQRRRVPTAGDAERLAAALEGWRER